MQKLYFLFNVVDSRIDACLGDSMPVFYTASRGQLRVSIQVSTPTNEFLHTEFTLAYFYFSLCLYVFVVFFSF